MEVVRLSGSIRRGEVDDGLTREPPLTFGSGIGFKVLLGVEFDGPPGVGERLGVLVGAPTDGARLRITWRCRLAVGWHSRLAVGWYCRLAVASESCPPEPNSSGWPPTESTRAGCRSGSKAGCTSERFHRVPNTSGCRPELHSRAWCTLASTAEEHRPRPRCSYCIRRRLAPHTWLAWRTSAHEA